MALAELEQEIFEINDANGWFEQDRSVGDDIALIHSEVSEMLEAFRDHGLADMTAGEKAYVETLDGHRDVLLPKPTGFGSECADVLIRLLDTCRRRGIDLAFEVERKNEFNRHRGYRHGGKLL